MENINLNFAWYLIPKAMHLEPMVEEIGALDGPWEGDEFDGF